MLPLNREDRVFTKELCLLVAAMLHCQFIHSQFDHLFHPNLPHNCSNLPPSIGLSLQLKTKISEVVPNEAKAKKIEHFILLYTYNTSTQIPQSFYIVII